jgi:hypothetical protein
MAEIAKEFTIKIAAFSLFAPWLIVIIHYNSMSTVLRTRRGDGRKQELAQLTEVAESLIKSATGRERAPPNCINLMTRSQEHFTQ